MSKPASGAAAAAAALTAWLSVPLVTMRRHGTLDEQQWAAIRGETRTDDIDEEARHRAALRRARVREAQVRATVATIPAQRSSERPRRSPSPW